jgi:hypothetical protein
MAVEASRKAQARLKREYGFSGGCLVTKFFAGNALHPRKHGLDQDSSSDYPVQVGTLGRVFPVKLRGVFNWEGCTGFGTGLMHPFTVSQKRSRFFAAIRRSFEEDSVSVLKPGERFA